MAAAATATAEKNIIIMKYRSYIDAACVAM